MRLNVLLPLLLSAVPAFGDGTNAPMPLADVAAHVTMPPGFRATLFAGEPDICQPIAMAFDDRSRLWVVENNTYHGSGQ